MPKRTESHELDAAAEHLLTDKLPKGWVARRQEPDYGNPQPPPRAQPLASPGGASPRANPKSNFLSVYQ